MRRSQIFLFLVGTLFIALTLLFLFFPRPTFSELERRELSRFPEFTTAKLVAGDYTREISSWFSDTQPFRDHFLGFAMELKDFIALHSEGEEAVTFHASADAPIDDPDADLIAEPADSLLTSSSPAQGEIEDYDGHAIPDGAAKMSSSGVIIVGSGPSTRALMAFGGTERGGGTYAEAANLYNSTLGPDVRVYTMVVPLASEFYTPEKAKKMTNPQLPVIRKIYSRLDPGVTPVDAYSALASHASEAIYLRTDHHWAPLGAYYAAEAFARAAAVPFIPIDDYEPHVIARFVGTMYGFSKDIAVKDAPEDFIYYTPRGVEYTTMFTTIQLDKNFRPKGESKPHKGRFFQHHSDGSSNAYLTFMGGDYNQTVVTTSTKNGRRLVIIKDSYGNALPGFLFGSFEEIHVLDHRYFRHAVKDYVAQHNITDLLMVNNIFNAYSSGVAKRYKYILTNATTAPAPEPTPAPTPTTPDTIKPAPAPAPILPSADSVAPQIETPDTTITNPA